MSELDPELYGMIAADPFARLLGTSLDDLRPGHARMSLTVTPDLVGPHGKTHGGTVMSLAEAALAAATHAYGTIHLALSVNVTFHKATTAGDRLTAEVIEQRAGGRIGGYEMHVTDQDGALVATCQAVVYRTTERLTTKNGREDLAT
jgi:acyl-CoA thioesterase